MEELQSTEVLDREILEDARKKAHHILKAAEESLKNGVEAWEKRGDAAIAEVQREYAERGVKTRRELTARLVLDKRRIRSEKLEVLLKSAMETYLLGLKRETLLSILERRLQKQVEALRETGELPAAELTVQSHQIQDEELGSILNRNLPQGSWSITPMPAGFMQEDPFPVIIMDAPAMRILTSIGVIAKELLEDKRAELVGALLGEEALLGGDAV